MLGIVGDSYDPHKPVYGDGGLWAHGWRTLRPVVSDDNMKSSTGWRVVRVVRDGTRLKFRGLSYAEQEVQCDMSLVTRINKSFTEEEGRTK